MGLDLSLGNGRGGSSGAATIAAPFSRVNGPSDDPFTAGIVGSFEGWSVNNVGAISDDTLFTVSRQGFDATCSAKTYLDNFWVLTKLRQPSPNDASLSTSSYALSDYIYSTDTPSGSPTNNSTIISPKPVCNWAMLARDVVGNTINLELTAWHRNARQGRQVAAVKFIATDGTTTVSQIVATTVVSSRTTDKQSVTVYACALDITTLTDNHLVTVDAEVYPWIGADNVTPASSSVAKSASDGNAARGFSSRYYLKNTTLASSPPYVYVSTTGNDTTGVVSTTAATAAATPCLTITGAIKRLTAVLGATTGVDGAIIRVEDGTYTMASSGANQTQKVGRVTVERSPTSTNRAAVIIQGGASAISLQLGAVSLTAPVATGCIRFRDVTGKRTGGQTYIGGNTVNLELQWDDCDFDTNGNTGTLYGTACHWYMNGMTFLNTFNGGLNASTGGEVRLARGITMPNNGGIDNFLVLGSSMNVTGTGVFSNGAVGRTWSGTIFAFNKVVRNSGVNTTTWDPRGDGVGCVNSMNLYEWCTASSGHSFCMSNDGANYSNTHVIEHHNTYAGAAPYGRENTAYDEGKLVADGGSALERISKLWSAIGNIHVGVYTKGDRFEYYNNANPEGATSGSPSQRLGNWAFKYTCGRRDNFHMYMANGAVGSGSTQNFERLPRGNTAGVNFNNSSETVLLDPLFTTVASATYVVGVITAGAGGGDYRLQNTSPARAMVSDPVLSHTLDGVARLSTNDHAGAYSSQ
jgi:hypothetical protein